MDLAKKGEQRIPFPIRLKAWWEGYDPADLMRLRGGWEGDNGVGADPEDLAVEAPPEEVVRYSDSHIAFAELAWGEGSIGPDSQAFVLDLAKPLALDPKHSVLNLGAGLGASTRAIAKAFDVWIEGLEANSTLAKLAAERSVKAGLGERAMVRHYDPEAADLQEGRYDAIFSREALFVVANKKALFEGLRDALKANGQLLFTDFVLSDPGAEDAAVKSWKDKEAEAPTLWTIKQVTDGLTSLGLEVRISEDISDRFQQVVQQEWARLLDKVQQNQLPRRLQNYLTEAAELERYRMAALDGGSLRVYRFHTYK